MKNIILFLALCAAALAQTIPPGVGVYNLSGGSGGGGSGTITAGTTNRIPKYTASTTIGNSLLADDGTTLTYTGTGGFSLTSSSTAVFTITGATSGSFIFTGVDAMGQALTLKAAAQTVGAATLSTPDLAGVNATIARVTDTYGTHLGTFASPNTAAGAITWASPVYSIYTSAAATRTYTLPAASSYPGQAVILYVAVGTGHVNFQPASGAQLVLAGVLLTANHYIQAATSAPGNYMILISDGTNWISMGFSGTWADSASA